MDPFSYLMPQPPLELTPQMTADFENLYSASLSGPAGAAIDYRLPYPKWQFLAYLGNARPVVFHGTRLTDLQVVEPRQSNDSNEFGAQNAIYASEDGIWAMFFAILDRSQGGMSMINSAVRIKLASGELSKPYYFFSISQAALARQPWLQGAIYILPRETFVQDPLSSAKGYEVVVQHWASRQAARPIARLSVGPQDFPFLAQIRGHNDAIVFERARLDPNGFPWLDE